MTITGLFWLSPQHSGEMTIRDGALVGQISAGARDVATSASPAGSGNRVRGKTNFPNLFNANIVVQSFREKYSYFSFSETVVFSAACLPGRGAYASSRTWGGERWTLMARLTSVFEADGEVVWF
jgi:hypothetical protein